LVTNQGFHFINIFDFHSDFNNTCRRFDEYPKNLALLGRNTWGMVMKEYTRETISKTISQINKNILLPDIQRPFVWDKEQIYKLFDSLMRGYPISTFLYWQLTREQLTEIEKADKLRIKMYKFVDSNDEENEEENNRDKDSYSLVLDGQQRLTSLYIALKGIWKEKLRKKNIQKELYYNVLSGQTENEDGVLYEFLFIDRNDGVIQIEEIENEKIEKKIKCWINVKKVFEKDLGQAKKRGVFVDEIVAKDVRMLEFKNDIDDIIDRFNDVLKDDGVINFFPEDETNYDRVLDIFVRTNSGGTKLGYSDLLFSKIKLRWEDARAQFKELLASVNKNNFEFDADFILKACLVIFSKKSEDVKYNVNNLNDTLINDIVVSWVQIVQSIKITISLLDRFLMKDKKMLPSYNALIPMIYWVYKTKRSTYRDDLEHDVKEQQILRVWLVKALMSGAFSGQSDLTLYKCKEAIDNAGPTLYPAEDVEKNIQTMKNRSMNIDTDKYDQISYRSKESYLFLALCYKMAVNFQPITDGNLPEQDHIFSKDELKKANIPEDKINSIYNIRFVSLIDNRKKSKMPFTDWVKQLDTNKDTVFKTHGIPQGSWTVDNFDAFLNERKILLQGNLVY